MFTLLLAAALPAAPAAPPPAPLPDRWLLKLVPKDVPALPDAFWKTTWTHGFGPRGGGGWTEWFAFGRGDNKTPAEVAITRREGFPNPGGVVSRSLPLAVHGPLVEFDRHLFTAAVTEHKGADDRVTQLLVLGAAVEVRPNAWYQAYTEDFSDGKVRVTELFAEFASDPRASEDGKVKFRKFVRMLTERDGELTEFDGTFAKARGRFGPAVRLTSPVRPGGAEGVTHVWLELPYKEAPARFTTAPELRLTAATDAAPKPPQANPPALVEPPPPPMPEKQPEKK